MNISGTRLLFPLFILALSIWVYYPGLDGGFTFDDDFNIQNNEYLKIESFSLEDLWQASMSGSSGPLKRPIAMLSFAVNHALTAMDTWWMKVTNLFIHLLNGILVWVIVRKVLRRITNIADTQVELISQFITAIWLIHPVNLTAVAYIVQRMTSLSSTFVLLSVCCYLGLRERAVQDWKAYLLGLSVLLCWLLGLLTKETALLLSIYIFVVECCVYKFLTRSRLEKRNLATLLAIIAAPWLMAPLYAVYDPSFILDSYKFRDFTLMERVLTEFRIVVDYLRLILVPDLTQMGLYHDDISPSRSLIDPITTLFSFLSITGLLVLALCVRKKFPLFCLGVFWFFGGHVLESSIFALELMFLHRNYIPAIGVMLAIAQFVVLPARKYSKLIGTSAILMLLMFAVCTRSLAYHWSGDFKMQLIEAIYNPTSIRANFRAGEISKFYAQFLSDRDEKMEAIGLATDYFSNIRELDPLDISGDMGVLETYLHTNEDPPRQVIENLVRDLPHVRADLGVLLVFSSYSECFTTREQCKLSPADFDRMYEAILANPDTDTYKKRGILVSYAKYLADYQNDIDTAIVTLKEALLAYPTLEEFKLLTLYFERGAYYDEMRRAIEFLEDNDTYGMYRKFIRQSRSRLKEHIDSG